MSDFSRLLSGFSQSFGFVRILGFPPLIPPRFTLLVVGWSSPMALLLPVSPSSTASACHQRCLISLIPSPLPSVLQILCTVGSFCFVSLLLVYMTYCSLASCSLFRLGDWVLRCPGSPLSLFDSAFFLGFTSSSFNLPLGMDHQVYLHAHVQRREEETRLDLLQKDSKKIDRTPPGDEKTDQGKENTP